MPLSYNGGKTYAAADEETRRFVQAMGGRAIDAQRLAAVIRVSPDASLLSILNVLAVVAADQNAVLSTMRAWLAWYDGLFARARSVRAGRMDGAPTRVCGVGRNAAVDSCGGCPDADGKRVRWRPSRLDQLRRRDQRKRYRHECRRSRHAAQRANDSRAGDLPWRASAALLGDGGCQGRVRSGACGSNRSGAPDDDRVRQLLRQRLVRRAARSPGGFSDAGGFVGRDRHVRRAEPAAPDRRSGAAGPVLLDVAAVGHSASGRCHRWECRRSGAEPVLPPADHFAKRRWPGPRGCAFRAGRDGEHRVGNRAYHRGRSRERGIARECGARRERPDVGRGGAAAVPAFLDRSIQLGAAAAGAAIRQQRHDRPYAASPRRRAPARRQQHAIYGAE